MKEKRLLDVSSNYLTLVNSTLIISNLSILTLGWAVPYHSLTPNFQADEDILIILISWIILVVVLGGISWFSNQAWPYKSEYETIKGVACSCFILIIFLVELPIWLNGNIIDGFRLYVILTLAAFNYLFVRFSGEFIKSNITEKENFDEE